jgi:uncharacterized protein YgiM (DUF1202 family)
MRRLLLLVSILALLLTACGTPSDQTVLELPPTATLQPIPSLTQRVTATLAPSRTPLPTFTFTPTQTEIPPTVTLTYTPTLTPTVAGIVQSRQRVNVRTGPGETYDTLTSLVPGTGVQVIGQDADGTWFNIRLEDGREAWIFGSLLRVEPTSTPMPSLTPSPDLTALFLGTPLPTAILGGGTVTPTPPPQVQTGTPQTAADLTAEPFSTPGSLVGVPVINNTSIFATATALAGGAASPTPLPEQTSERLVTLEATGTPGTQTAAQASPTGMPDQVDGIDVFAFCDDPRFGISAPSTLRAGMMIDIWWDWYASTEQQVEDHIDASSHEIRVNGELIANVNRFAQPVRTAGGQFATSWYIPYGPLAAGTYEITYVVTWSRVISDGPRSYGPGTNIPFEQETCTITVR